MRIEDKERFICRKAAENQLDPSGSKVYWSRHSIGEMIDEDLTRAEMESAFRHCEVIEDYPATHRPLPDCLILAWLADGRPLHAVIAIDDHKDRIFVVTVYVPDRERWHDDWRTRK